MNIRQMSLLATVTVGCAAPPPNVGSTARADTGAATLVGSSDLVDSRIPSARAGDAGWRYQQRVSADLDADGVREAAVLISDVQLDARGQPIWEHGHRWQVYVQEPDGEVTRVYARFLPNGKLTAELTAPESGAAPTIVLLEQTPQRIGVYEVSYRRPGRVEIRKHLDRAIETWFIGSPRP
jgi:hypothetical protein